MLPPWDISAQEPRWYGLEWTYHLFPSVKVDLEGAPGVNLHPLLPLVALEGDNVHEVVV